MTVDWARMGRRIAAVTSAAAIMLAGAACAGRGRQSGSPVLVAPAGSAGLLSTTQGVIWSFQRGHHSYGVLRSPDKGHSWVVALPGQGTDSGLVASYFLGPGEAWMVDQQLGHDGRATTTVLGTSNGGKQWWRSHPLPQDATGQDYIPHDQVYFTDAMHGWLLATGTKLGPPSAGPLPEGTQRLELWSTTDGGRIWTHIPDRALPLQGLPLAGVGQVRCANQPAITFANPIDGWLVQGSCGHGNARPLVWRTTDGGRRWRPVPLRAPAGGWGVWAGTLSTSAKAGATVAGVDVGQARVVAWGIHAMLLVPVAIRRSGVLIERSDDGGRTWRIAARLHTGTQPSGPAPAWSFDPIDARDWVISAPGVLFETADLGRHWTVTRSALSLPRSPASFVNLDHGYVQGTGTVAVLRTADHGRTWLPEQAPARAGRSALAARPAISTVQHVTRHLAVAAGADGLETSSDDGRTWTVRFSVPGPVRQVDFAGPRVGFAVAGGELLRTRNAGVTWYPIPQPIAGPVGTVDFWTAKDGVAELRTSAGYYITRDGGTNWMPLRLPAGWTTNHSGVPWGPWTACFAKGGIGWIAASRGHRTGVLVTADGGRHWRVALPPRAVPGSAATPRTAGLAGCDGTAAWVLVAHANEQHADAMTYDLLRTPDLGWTWLDMLRTPGAADVPRPVVPLSPGWPFAPAWAGRAAKFRSLALGSASSAFYTFTGRDGSGLGVGSTDDAGLMWSWHRFGPLSRTGRSAHDGAHYQAPARHPRRWLATCSLDARRAWVLFAGPPRSGTSYLYATSDGGLIWHLLASFRPSSAQTPE